MILMHDFSCIDPDDMHYGILAERTRYFKEDKEGVAVMCKVIEDMRLEERKEVSVEMACRMLKDGTLSIEKIAEYADLPLEEVKELAKRNTV